MLGISDRLETWYRYVGYEGGPRLALALGEGGFEGFHDLGFLCFFLMGKGGRRGEEVYKGI